MSIISADQLVPYVVVAAFVNIIKSEHNVLSVKVVAFVSITSADYNVPTVVDVLFVTMVYRIRIAENVVTAFVSITG